MLECAQPKLRTRAPTSARADKPVAATTVVERRIDGGLMNDAEQRGHGLGTRRGVSTYPPHKRAWASAPRLRAVRHGYMHMEVKGGRECLHEHAKRPAKSRADFRSTKALYSRP